MSDLHTRIQRAVGAVECEKVMSRHVYWHSAGIHRDEWEEYWSKKVDITWAHGWGRQDDRYSYYFSYVLEKERNAFKTFMGIKLKYPDVENCTRLDGVAEYSNHLTTSPVIEVAEDGKSAKGLWYTPGFINSHASRQRQDPFAGALGALWRRLCAGGWTLAVQEPACLPGYWRQRGRRRLCLPRPYGTPSGDAQKDGAGDGRRIGYPWHDAQEARRIPCGAGYGGARYPRPAV